MSYFGLNSLIYLVKVVKHTGGIRKTFHKLYMMEEVKMGTLVGTDEFGNKYFDNPRFFYGRNRWVEYAPQYRTNYDASQVPAEWYGWLHYKTDYLPDDDPGRPKYKWMATHTENLTGTTAQYVPYSTTLPKIQAWMPKKE